MDASVQLYAFCVASKAFEYLDHVKWMLRLFDERKYANDKLRLLQKLPTQLVGSIQQLAKQLNSPDFTTESSTVIERLYRSRVELVDRFKSGEPQSFFSEIQTANKSAADYSCEWEALDWFHYDNFLTDKATAIMGPAWDSLEGTLPEELQAFFKLGRQTWMIPSSLKRWCLGESDGYDGLHSQAVITQQDLQKVLQDCQNFQPALSGISAPYLDFDLSEAAEELADFRSSILKKLTAISDKEAENKTAPAKISIQGSAEEGENNHSEETTPAGVEELPDWVTDESKPISCIETSTGLSIAGVEELPDWVTDESKPIPCIETSTGLNIAGVNVDIGGLLQKILIVFCSCRTPLTLQDISEKVRGEDQQKPERANKERENGAESGLLTRLREILRNAFGDDTLMDPLKKKSGERKAHLSLNAEWIYDRAVRLKAEHSANALQKGNVTELNNVRIRKTGNQKSKKKRVANERATTPLGEQRMTRSSKKKRK